MDWIGTPGSYVKPRERQTAQEIYVCRHEGCQLYLSKTEGRGVVVVNGGGDDVASSSMSSTTATA